MVKLGTIKYEDYVDWWSLQKEPRSKRNPLELLVAFPHVQHLIKYTQTKKKDKRVNLYRSLMIDQSTHPCDLFLI